MKTLLIFLSFLFLFFSCSDNGSVSETEVFESEENFHLNYPKGFPEMEIPEDNPMTTEKVELGKRLFFDPILSKDSSISCSSCHLPELAFTDGRNFSLGVNDSLSLRNAPSLFNVGYGKSFFRDGGAPSLEVQIITPIQDEHEMNLPIKDALKRLNEHPDYPDLFEKTFGQRKITMFELSRAIAAYERTLISGNSAYDAYKYDGDKRALSEEEQKGMELFFSDQLQCAECHSGFNFTREEYECNGIYKNYDDIGRMRITHDSSDWAKFKVPSLRNVELTAPYMHDGSFESLEDVIDHYASGGKNHPNKSEKIQGFDITEEEKKCLLLFLKSLTDTTVTP